MCVAMTVSMGVCMHATDPKGAVLLCMAADMATGGCTNVFPLIATPWLMNSDALLDVSACIGVCVCDCVCAFAHASTGDSVWPPDRWWSWCNG